MHDLVRSASNRKIQIENRFQLFQRTVEPSLSKCSNHIFDSSYFCAPAPTELLGFCEKRDYPAGAVVVMFVVCGFGATSVLLSKRLGVFGVGC